jgi:hypothetical protein
LPVSTNDDPSAEAVANMRFAVPLPADAVADDNVTFIVPAVIVWELVVF